MAKSWVEEFNKRYNQPQVDNVIVGFSGIDPAPKSAIDSNIFYIDGGVITESGEVTVDSGEITLP